MIQFERTGKFLFSQNSFACNCIVTLIKLYTTEQILMSFLSVINKTVCVPVL